MANRSDKKLLAGIHNAANAIKAASTVNTDPNADLEKVIESLRKPGIRFFVLTHDPSTHEVKFTHNAMAPTKQLDPIHGAILCTEVVKACAFLMGGDPKNAGFMPNLIHLASLGANSIAPTEPAAPEHDPATDLLIPSSGLIVPKLAV